MCCAAAAISGGLYACSRKAVQASGRVDVQSGVLQGKEEEESKPPCVADCFPLLDVTGRHTRTKDTSPSIPVQASSYSVFVRSFTGSTMVLYVSPSMMVSALVQTIAERCQIPQHLFYLTLGGKVVDCGLTVREGRIGKDACLIMQGRLRGGGGGRVVIPGEWECAVCQLGGCWPARKRCFRCTHS